MSSGIRGTSWIGWALVVAGSVLIVVNSIPYFTSPATAGFFAERPALAADRLWRSAMITHISGGLVCLVAGPLLVWNLALRKSRRLHRWLGWLYVVSALGWALPAGLYVSIFAKGGVAGASGFLATGVLWAIPTVRGVIEIRRRRIPEHAVWMARSYAIVLSAVFFRVIFVGLQFTALGHDASYVAAIWLALGASLVVGESFVAQLHANRRIRTLSILPLWKEVTPC